MPVVPASKASIRQNQVKFELPDSWDENGEPVGKMTEFWLPKLGYVSPCMLKRVQDMGKDLREIVETGGQPSLDDVIAMRVLFRDILDEYAPELSARLDDHQTDSVFQQWQKESQVGMGESLASADS